MTISFDSMPHLYLAVTSTDVYYLSVIIPLEDGTKVSGSPTQEGNNWYITIVDDAQAEGGFYEGLITIESQPVGVETVSVETRDSSGNKKGKAIFHYSDADEFQTSRSLSMVA